MPSTDAFALANSGLSRFLFSEVGTEMNGSSLTVLSVLARLGKDPWAEAARWARLPEAAMIDAIAASISQMPLNPEALVQARLTASRLIPLLPKTPSAPPTDNPRAVRLAASRWFTLALLLCAVAFGIAVQSIWSQPPAGAPPAQAISQGQ